jgi:hypothetical protein
MCSLNLIVPHTYATAGKIIVLRIFQYSLFLDSKLEDSSGPDGSRCSSTSVQPAVVSSLTQFSFVSYQIFELAVHSNKYFCVVLSCVVFT